MNLICCISNCPSLLTNGFIYSSNENLHCNSYAQKFTRRFSLSSNEKEILENVHYVSHWKLSMKILLFFRILQADSLIKSTNFDNRMQTMEINHRVLDECYLEPLISIIISSLPMKPTESKFMSYQTDRQEEEKALRTELSVCLS